MPETRSISETNQAVQRPAPPRKTVDSHVDQFYEHNEEAKAPAAWAAGASKYEIDLRPAMRPNTSA